MNCQIIIDVLIGINKEDVKSTTSETGRVSPISLENLNPTVSVSCSPISPRKLNNKVTSDTQTGNGKSTPVEKHEIGISATDLTSLTDDVKREVQHHTISTGTSPPPQSISTQVRFFLKYIPW